LPTSSVTTLRSERIDHFIILIPFRCCKEHPGRKTSLSSEKKRRICYCKWQ